MLDEVIRDLEQSNTNGAVRASAVQQAISKLKGAEGYRAQKAKELLEQKLSGSQNPSKRQDGNAEQVPIEDTLSALRALFEMQDD